MTRLDKNLAALPALSPAQLRERWEAAMGAGTTPSVPQTLLRRLLAQQLQEKHHGRLPALVARELDRVAAEAAGPAVEPARKAASLSPGTRLIREWNGRTIAVEVRGDGFSWNDRTYRSLSEIAREVTGAHWSGPRFFGLNRRG